jgi:hypothetical protein
MNWNLMLAVVIFTLVVLAIAVVRIIRQQERRPYEDVNLGPDNADIPHHHHGGGHDGHDGGGHDGGGGGGHH